MEPVDLINEMFDVEVTLDNESDDCELEWCQVLDLIHTCLRLNMEEIIPLIDKAKDNIHHKKLPSAYDQLAKAKMIISKFTS